MISRTVAALAEAPGALPCLPVTDTLKRGTDGGRFVGETVSREGLWRAQTPQGFRFAHILAAHREARGLELTDDAAVAERSGLAVRIVQGAETNVKITSTEDLHRAAQRFRGPGELRVGQGFDVHRFEAGDHVTLCGIQVPHTQGLEGHSDADVALHALTDALLGAVGSADIGRHFPPSDPQWKGAPSDLFVRHAAGLIAGLGGTVVNVDITLICERPKVGPHHLAMVEKVTEMLGIEAGRVNVKATTTEGLGFTGRREGIAAQAVASVRLPG